MKSMRITVIGIVVALAACGQQSAAPATAPSAEYTLEQAGDSIPLAMGKMVRVGGNLFQLTDVPGDSRCPREAVCVWAGDAIAAIAIHPGCLPAGCAAPSYLMSLHTGLEPRSGTNGGYRVTLLSLQPVPSAGKPTDRSAYVAWVRITSTS